MIREHLLKIYSGYNVTAILFNHNPITEHPKSNISMPRVEYQSNAVVFMIPRRNFREATAQSLFISTIDCHQLLWTTNGQSIYNLGYTRSLEGNLIRNQYQNKITIYFNDHGAQRIRIHKAFNNMSVFLFNHRNSPYHMRLQLWEILQKSCRKLSIFDKTHWANVCILYSSVQYFELWNSPLHWQSISGYDVSCKWCPNSQGSVGLPKQQGSTTTMIHHGSSKLDHITFQSINIHLAVSWHWQNIARLSRITITS